ncbi:MAG: hypothetical protein VX836_10215 [Pseudomonadota bacterium]|nr:hypothetical protein [Pseudomonadota bacterium]
MTARSGGMDVTLEPVVGLVRVNDRELMCRHSCGCQHEEWDYCGATFALHQDPGLPVQTLVMLYEDEETELPDAPTFAAAREQACKWIDARLRPNAY